MLIAFFILCIVGVRRTQGLFKMPCYDDYIHILSFVMMWYCGFGYTAVII